MNEGTRHRLTVNRVCLNFKLLRTNLRRRTIAIQLQPDGLLVVRAPKQTSLIRVRQALRQKAEWIQGRRFRGFNAVPDPTPPKEFIAGESFHFLGQQYRLRIETATRDDSVVLQGQYLVVRLLARKNPSCEEIRTRLSHWFKQQAKIFLPERVDRWLHKLEVRTPRRILISNQSHRWASCSSKAELRFNWRLMSVPVSLVDYVIVHELCHLKWANHSAHFWKELRRTMPDADKRHAQLNRLGGTWSF